MIERESETSDLPIRIMRMVKELHRRGYGSLYLYAGMSTNGMNWRYNIGLMVDGKWPAEPCLVKGSIGQTGEVPWMRGNSSIESLTDGFESYYIDQLRGSKSGATDYSMWYDRLINSLRADEVLKFFADWEAEHEWWLRDAPGFKKSDEL